MLVDNNDDFVSNFPFLSNKGTAGENKENEESNDTVRGDDFLHFQMNSTNVSADSERKFKW